MENIIKLETIQDYNNLLGTKTLHPLVSVTDLSTLKSIRHCRKNFGFYCVFYKELACGTLQYGRNKYDYEDGTLVFISPGQIAGINDDGETVNPKGIVLMFHADLLYGTPLARRMKDYTFFSYESNEALHMSDRERRIILNCFHEIREELEHTIDKHRNFAQSLRALLRTPVRDPRSGQSRLAYQFRTNTSTVFRFGEDVYHRIAIRTVLCRTDASFSELFRRSGEKGNRKIGTRIYSVGHHGKSKRIVGRKQ